MILFLSVLFQKPTSLFLFWKHKIQEIFLFIHLKQNRAITDYCELTIMQT